MPRGRSAGYEQQRERILQCAAALFARQGYPSTSMNQIAAACGLSKATLYHYLGDKDALLYSIAERHVMRLLHLLHTQQQRPLPPQARLAAVIEAILDEYAQARDAHRVLTHDVRFLGARERELILQRERQVVAGFAGLLTAIRPDLRSHDMDKPMTLLVFGMMNWLFTWLRPEGWLDHARLAPVLTQLLLGGLPAVTLPSPPAPAAQSPDHPETAGLPPIPPPGTAGRSSG